MGVPLNGPGKYDHVCTFARKETRAEGVALIVFHGNEGHGFSVQGTSEFLLRLTHILRKVADEIDQQSGLA